ncbi:MULTISPECIES: GNAT family N-acetyltransferase [Bacillaceae]|uniref:GNAT family N-acetyltransferase n=1 Tax=Evansella alkalicola TaxID=745819 RepID=A0ABS6JP34_9BACI|nr:MULTISPECIES: GNAT family protein [Bacillaceae]MBU9719851.1 GNAT family N-acetyltransferase [Bacillus alkalicola]
MEIEDIYGDLPSLETDRLVLRKITLNDVDDMYSYSSSNDVSRYVTWDTHDSIKDTKAFVKFAKNQYENKKIAPWGIILKENDKFIGTIDFVWWKPVHKTAEIGYVLSQEYWGQGLMPEAAREIIKFGFEKMDLVRIQAKCFVENVPSQRVMEKVGMTYEGTLRKSMLVKGEHRDLKTYSILREEFEGKSVD